MFFDIFQAALVGILVALAMTACIMAGVMRLLSTTRDLRGGITLIMTPVFVVMVLLFL